MLSPVHFVKWQVKTGNINNTKNRQSEIRLSPIFCPRRPQRPQRVIVPLLSRVDLGPF